MSTKKKPASKPAAKGPTPLLKVSFECQKKTVAVPVYFETTKRCFYADFGFEQYESTSVAGLEQKIKAAIKAGATLTPVWTPVIDIECYPDNGYQAPGPGRLTAQWELAVDRCYVAVVKGKLREALWNVPAAKRIISISHEEALGDLKALKLPLRAKGTGFCNKLLVAYDEALFRRLMSARKAINGIFEQLQTSIAARNLPSWYLPEATAPKKPAKPKAAAGRKPDPRQPELPLGGEPRKFIKAIPAAKLSPKRLDKALDAIRTDVKSASTKPAAKKKTNGDHTAREHLVVKYLGKEVTLGHGHVGTYLVNALKRHYPDISSAFVLKNNHIQLSFFGMMNDSITIDGAEFEQKINNPAARTAPTLGVYGGTGAIAKLHELVDAMQPEDPPLEIPSLILMAAGFPATATAELHDPQEIILRVPKKAPQFISLQQLEEKILEQFAAAEKEGELVGA